MAANDKPSALRSGSQVKSKPVGVRILDPTGDDKTAEPVSGSAESWALVTHRGDRECSTVWPARFSNVSVRAPFMGCGAIGSASVFGTEGCRFDSYHPSHFTDRSPFVFPFSDLSCSGERRGGEFVSYPEVLPPGNLYLEFN